MSQKIGLSHLIFEKTVKLYMLFYIGTMIAQKVTYFAFIIALSELFSLILFQYSALEIGTTGAGGEYDPQTGFGWTNALTMEFFNTWGRYLKSENAL